MKIKKTYIVTIWFACFCLSSLAQQGTIALERRALDAALTTIEDYSVWSTLSNAEANYEFINLFSNKSSLVYNDLLGIKRGKNLTAEEYAKIMQQGLDNKKCFLKNITTEGVIIENEKIIVRISVDKAISYIDTCGTYFSSSEFYEADHHLIFTLIYDEHNRICKIERISGQINSENQLPTQYVVFESQDNRDNQLLYKHQPIRLNSYNQAFLEGTYSSISRKHFSYPDRNVGYKLTNNQCHMSMKYRKLKLRLKPHFEIGIGKTYKIENLRIMSSKKNSTTSFGIDFGYMLCTTRHFGLGLFSGISFSRSKLDLYLASNDYSFQTDADVDKDTYLRHYQDLTLSQTFKFQDISLPLYMDMDFYIGNLFSFYLDLGVKANFNITHRVEDTQGNAYVYGVYPQYDNLMLNDSWSYNGFGDYQFSQQDINEKDVIDVNNKNIDLMGNVGFRFTIPYTPLSVDLGINYLMGFSDLLKTKELVGQESGTTNPIIYNTIHGDNSIEHVHNLTESIHRLKHRSLRLSLGLLWKF